MTAQNDIQEVELNIEFAKERIELLNALDRLLKNADFKLVISEGYMEKEAIRLVKALANGAILPEGKAEIQKDIEGIGRLDQYFEAIVQIGRAQENTLNAYQDTLTELEAESE